MLEVQSMNPIQKLIHKVGGQGPYQMLMFISFGLKWMIAAMFLFSLNFLFLTKDFQCDNSQNGTMSCSQFVCSNPDPEFWLSHLPQVPNSLSYYFDPYICKKAWIASTVQSFTYWGSLLGYIVFSYIADNFGRRKAQILAWGSACIGSILLFASLNIYMVALGLFICGMGINASITLHYTFIKQFVVGKWRQRMIISLQILFSIGIMLIATVSIHLQNWRYLSLLLASLICISYISSFYLPQTLQFLISKDYTQLVNTLNKIALTNKRSQLLEEQITQILDNNIEEKSQLTMYHLFKYKSLRLTTYACGIINIANQFLYDGTIFNFNRMGLNVYTNQIVIGFIQIWAAVYGNFIISKIRRKCYSFFALLICGLFTLALFFVGYNQEIQKNKQGYLQLALLMCMRFVLSSFWGIFFVYVGELFPSQITSIAYAYVSTIGTLGASASPYIKLATKNFSMIIMTIICVVSGLHVLFLPETKNNPTQLHIKEEEREVVNKGSMMSN